MEGKVNILSVACRCHQGLYCLQEKNGPHKQNTLFIKSSKRNDTGGNKLTRQVNKRLMHSNTIKIVLILLQTKHATNAVYSHLKENDPWNIVFKILET